MCNTSGAASTSICQSRLDELIDRAVRKAIKEEWDRLANKRVRELSAVFGTAAPKDPRRRAELALCILSAEYTIALLQASPAGN